jgi:hypothetical protein
MKQQIYKNDFQLFFAQDRAIIEAEISAKLGQKDILTN